MVIENAAIGNNNAPSEKPTPFVLLNLYEIDLPGMQQGRGQGGQLPPQILADQLTLSQPGGADYAHHSTTCPPGFLTLAASLP